MTLYSTLRRSTKPLNRVSAKRRDYEAELDRMKPFVRSRSGGWCEARISAVCWLRASEVHHRRTRGRQGGNDLANLLDMCGPCHQFAHDNPDQATAWGLLVPSHADPANVPVLAGRKA